MDFGSFDGQISSDNNNNSLISSSAFDLNPNPTFYGFKLQTSLSASASASATPTAHNQDLKLPKITQHDFSKTMLQQQQQRSNTTSSDSHNMLTFSSPNTPTFPYYALNNTGGYGGTIRGVIPTGGGVRGPFTPSQWMELEHQALIYKYITVNAPIPFNLLIPIKKALETAAFYPGTNLRNTYGWDGFQLGFSNSSDPEPGRCRRTDGKKWRCSRDAVADQKYCERHMNRGRHRSRKPVEGQTGHSVSNRPTTATAAKVSASAAVGTTIISHLHQQNQHQLTSKTQPATIAITNDNRSFLNKGIMAPSSIGLKQNPPSEFGFVCSNSLLNPLQKNDNGDQKSQNSLRQFMDDWPHSDKTQLSISIPMVSSDFMSTNSSPINERPRNLSPLRMGLGVVNTTNVFDERAQQSSWIPFSWESSMGGPLGEVLNHSTNNSPSALNLMTDGWESSQQMTLSPTGVLQKTAFGCYSNSSTGSSPRTDNRLLGSTLITSSLPLL